MPCPTHMSHTTQSDSLKRLLAAGHRWEGDGWKPTQARGAWSYRGARRNTDRGRRASEILKAARLELGITRREMDYRRWFQRELAALGDVA